MVNKIIVTALNDEANPIIKFYNLSRDTRHSDLKVYINVLNLILSTNYFYYCFRIFWKFVRIFCQTTMK